MDELLKKGIDKEHIIYMNFEDFDNYEYADLKKFNEFVKSKIVDDKKYYLFFDEIQNVN